MNHFGDNIISFLKKSINQLEELQIQAELGKAEFKEKYNSFKLNFEKNINQIRSGNTDLQKNIHEKTITIKQKIDEMEIQFALGKKETKELIENKIKILKNHLIEIKNDFKKKLPEKEKI
jgi:hypothetical protein